MNEELNNYLKHARDITLPGIKQSAISMIILNADPDPKLCLELGASILYEKPIILLVKRDTIVPEPLRRIAERVIVVDELNDEAKQQMVDAIKEILLTLFPQRIQE